MSRSRKIEYDESKEFIYLFGVQLFKDIDYVYTDGNEHSLTLISEKAKQANRKTWKKDTTTHT